MEQLVMVAVKPLLLCTDANTLWVQTGRLSNFYLDMHNVKRLTSEADLEVFFKELEHAKWYIEGISVLW